MLEQKALSKYVDDDLNFVRKFLTEKAFLIDGIFTMHPKEALDFWESVANKENPNSTSAAVIFYVALYKTLPEIIRRSYSKNVSRIRRSLNTLLVFTEYIPLLELENNQGFKEVQGQLKQQAQDVVKEKQKTGSLEGLGDTTPYLMRLATIPFDILSDGDSLMTLFRIVSHLPITFDNIEVDYYEHLDRYLSVTDEDSIPDSGETVFVLNMLLKNYEDVDFEVFCKVDYWCL